MGAGAGRPRPGAPAPTGVAGAQPGKFIFYLINFINLFFYHV
jgi:hypothetical protein